MSVRRHSGRHRLATLLMAVAAVAATKAAAQLSRPAEVVLRGRVLSAESEPRPLRNARIVVVGADREPIFTGADGQFAVAVSPSSSLRISKAGFAPAVVAAAAAPAGVLQIALQRGAVLTGLVVDESGFPVADARVHARWAGPAGSAPGATDFFTETDDAGEYRIGSLAAGRYTVNTEPQLPRFPEGALGLPGMERQMQEMRRLAVAEARPLSDLVTVALTAGEERPVVLTHRRPAVTPPDAPIAGAVTGVVLDEFGEPAGDVTVGLWLVRYAGDRSIAEPAGAPRHTDDRGHYRLFHVRPGRYLVAATEDDQAQAPVYFPGTTVVANAASVTVGRKEEVPGVNLVFTRVREARVAGVALNARGAPLQGSVTLIASRRAGALALSPRTARTDTAGAFAFDNVAPGEYVLRATEPADGGIRMQPLREFGMQFVTVNSPEVPPITIVTARTATLAGQVVLEGDTTGMSPADVFVSVLPDADSGPLGPWLYEGRVAADRTFELAGVAGTVRLRPMPPPGWWVKSVALGAVDVTDGLLRLSGPDDSRSDVTIVIAQGTATLHGRVTDDGGRPVDDYRVVVFSTNRERWFGGSPYVTLTGGPEIDGGFTVRDLPPGDYWAIAAASIEGDGAAGEWQDPEVLARLATDATRVSLGQGQSANVELRIRVR